MIGGPRRAAELSKKPRAEIASKAVRARWAKNNPAGPVPLPLTKTPRALMISNMIS